MKQIQTTFFSGNERCDADLFLPDGVEKPPVIIFAHGFSYPKFIGLISYARTFAAHGFATLIFDYRGMCFSEGKVRQLVDQDMQIEDLEAAVAYLRASNLVDGERIGMMSISYGAGHVLNVAAHDPGIKALVCLSPWMNPAVYMQTRGKKTVVSGLILGRLDQFSAFLHARPVPLPLRFAPHLLSQCTQDTFYPGYKCSCQAMKNRYGYPITRLYAKNISTGEESFWENMVPGRSFIRMMQYHPEEISSKVRCPVLVVAGKTDNIAPYTDIISWMKRLNKAELLSFDGGHFDADRKEIRSTNDPKILEFLERML